MTDFPISPVTTTLKPCPVCRSRLVSLFERQEGLFAVSCENDDCHFGVEAVGNTANDAVRQWNYRDGLTQSPAQSIDELAAEITEEIRCEQRARERVAKAEEISGDVYLLKVLLSVIASQGAALREYEAAVTETLADMIEKRPDLPLSPEDWRTIINSLRGHAQSPTLPDRERMAEILHTAAHKGLRNCWTWSDAELDHEHPGSRGYWYKIADGALAALAISLTLRECGFCGGPLPCLTHSQCSPARGSK
jgi:hypothetical protein